MSEQQYTDDEKKAAWDKAEPIEGKSESQHRFDIDGFHISWEKYNLKVNGGWVIDEEGNARHHDYHFRRAVAAHRTQQHDREIELYKQQAAEAGIPGAWQLFQRLAELEQEVKSLKQRLHSKQATATATQPIR